MKSRRDDDNLVGGPAYAQPAAEEMGTEGRDRLSAEQGGEEPGLREMGYAMVDLIVEYMNGLEGRRVYGPLTPLGLDDTLLTFTSSRLRPTLTSSVMS